MSGVTTNEPRLRPRRRWGRYSLRTLFLLTTAAALGLGWWRAPFVVETVHDVLEFSEVSSGNGPGAAAPLSSPRKVRLVQAATVHRTLWGDPVRHGPTRFYAGERLLAEQTWSEGVLHGPYTQWSLDGEVEVRGEYAAGTVDGDWTVTKVARSSFGFGCPFPGCWRFDDRENQSTVDRLLAELGRPSISDATTRFEQGKRTWTTEVVEGPEGVQELEVRFEVAEKSGIGFVPLRERRSVDGKFVLERVMVDSMQRPQEYRLQGWFASGEKRYQASFPFGSGGNQVRRQYWDRAGNLVHDLVVENARVLSDGGEAVVDPLIFRSSILGMRVTPRSGTYENLLEDVHYFCQQRPLELVIRGLSAAHQIPIALDREALAVAGISPTVPVTIVTRGLPLRSALAVALRPHGLTAVALHGQLFVTTFDRIPRQRRRSIDYYPCDPPFGWVDPTGVQTLVDENGKPIVTGDFKGKLDLPDEVALPEVINALAKQRGFPIELARQEFPEGALDERIAQLCPAQQTAIEVLGSTLFQTGARVRVDNGKLVVVPREPLRKRKPAPQWWEKLLGWDDD